MKKKTKRRKNRVDDEYQSLKRGKGSKNSIKIENIDETIVKYKKLIRIFGYIIVILFILIIILLFSRKSIETKENEIIKNKKLLMESQEFNNKNNETGYKNENKAIDEAKDNKNNNEDENLNKNDNNNKNDKNEENDKNKENKENDNNNQNNLNIMGKNKTNSGEKRKIYVKYMDFWPAFELDRFDVHKILLEKYDVVLSENPDYVIFGEFGGENYGIENRFNCVKLFLTIENRGPDFENTDYAIGIHYIEKGDRYFRKPTETHQLSAIYSVYNVTQVKGIDISKKKFCAWVVSNGSGDVRNQFFDRLSEYKTVDSGGGFRNNIGGPVSDKLKFLADYKFSICFENSKTDGYISEKLSDAFEAGTIPIYYGDDTVLELLNNRSYIHVRDESEFDEKIELIKKIDQNDTLYQEVIREKIVIDDSRYPKEVQKYKDFIYHIIEQDKEKAKRFERKKKD